MRRQSDVRGVTWKRSMLRPVGIEAGAILAHRNSQRHRFAPFPVVFTPHWVLFNPLSTWIDLCATSSLKCCTCFNLRWLSTVWTCRQSCCGLSSWTKISRKSCFTMRLKHKISLALYAIRNFQARHESHLSMIKFVLGIMEVSKFLIGLIWAASKRIHTITSRFTVVSCAAWHRSWDNPGLVGWLWLVTSRKVGEGRVLSTEWRQRICLSKLRPQCNRPLVRRLRSATTRRNVR